MALNATPTTSGEAVLSEAAQSGAGGVAEYDMMHGDTDAERTFSSRCYHRHSPMKLYMEFVSQHSLCCKQR
jgi:hypothetical protein